MQIVNRDARRDVHLYASDNLRLQPLKRAAHRCYRHRCKIAIRHWLLTATEADEDLNLSLRDKEALSGWELL